MLEGIELLWSILQWCEACANPFSAYSDDDGQLAWLPLSTVGCRWAMRVDHPKIKIGIKCHESNETH